MKTVFKELYEQQKDAVYSYLFYMTQDKELADDLSQETFLKIYMNLKKLKSDAYIKAWCMTIARNTFLSYARKKKPILLEAEALEAVAGQTDRTPEVVYLELEKNEKIYRTLQTLSEHDRSALILSDYEGLSYREVAKVLEISEAAVKVRIYRARRRFRSMYLEEGKEVKYEM